MTRARFRLFVLKVLLNTKRQESCMDMSMTRWGHSRCCWYPSRVENPVGLRQGCKSSVEMKMLVTVMLLLSICHALSGIKIHHQLLLNLHNTLASIFRIISDMCLLCRRPLGGGIEQWCCLTSVCVCLSCTLWIFMVPTATGTRCARHCRHKACMGWSWATPCTGAGAYSTAC